MEVSKLGQSDPNKQIFFWPICFCFASFFFFLWENKKKNANDIFIRKHSSYNSPDLGSIFLIEERENKESSIHK